MRRGKLAVIPKELPHYVPFFVRGGDYSPSSNRFPHYNCACSPLGQRCDSLEASFLEHRYSTTVVVRTLISLSYRISLNDSSSLLLYRSKGCLQSGTRHSSPSIFAVDNETSYSPQFFRTTFEGQFSIFYRVIDARELLSWTVLTPSNGFSFPIDQYPVSASCDNELFLLLTVSFGSLCSSSRLLVLWE